MAESPRALALCAFTMPYRLVFRNEADIWSPTADQIEDKSYDYVKLHRISASFDIGLSAPYCLHVGFDGTLLIPKIPETSPTERAVGVFNQVLGEILIGGIYFDAVRPTDVGDAIFYRTGYYRPNSMGSSLNGQLHVALQTKHAGTFESYLLHNPKHIFAKNLIQARRKGEEVTSKINTLRVDFILYGVSAYVSHEWNSSLAHLWIAIEQLIEYRWCERIEKGYQPSEPIPRRSEFLNDHRTWVISAKIEVLFQVRAVTEEVYHLLSIARKARNDLSHKGINVTKSAAEAAFNAVFQLIASICTPEDLHSFDETICAYKRLNPVEREYTPPTSTKVEDMPVDVWIGPMPPIPGENEWGNKDFDRVYLD